MYLVQNLHTLQYSAAKVRECTGIRGLNNALNLINCLLQVFTPKQHVRGSEKMQLKREIQALAHVGNHPHIASLEAVYETEQEFILILELAEQELFERLVDDEKPALQEWQARIIILGILQAVAHCHERHIVHRDIKAENVMLVRSDNWTTAQPDFGEDDTELLHAKLTDFGIAKVLEEQDQKQQPGSRRNRPGLYRTSTHIGTLDYLGKSYIITLQLLLLFLQIVVSYHDLIIFCMCPTPYFSLPKPLRSPEESGTVSKSTCGALGFFFLFCFVENHRKFL